MVAGRSNAPLIETPAFVLGKIDYGDADLIVHLLTEKLGKVSCLARGARRSKKRYAGALEPMHTLLVSLTESSRGEFVPLRDAILLKPRLQLTTRLEKMDVAGRALRWMKRAAPPKTPEPAAFCALEGFLDELDRQDESPNVNDQLAAFGLRMLTAFGWGLQLSACVSCGRPRPAGRPALLSPDRGGIVCRACGGGPFKLTSELIAQMRQASEGDAEFPRFDDSEKVLKVVDRALSAHLGLAPEVRR